MTRIGLQIQRHSHDLSRQVGVALSAVRIFAEVTLFTNGVSSHPYRAIVDTGAPISLFPQRMWRGFAPLILGDVRIGGIVSREECRIPAHLAMLDCILSDGISVTNPLLNHAYLAESDAVPALLGMAGLLDRARLLINVPGSEAYLET